MIGLSVPSPRLGKRELPMAAATMRRDGAAAQSGALGSGLAARLKVRRVTLPLYQKSSAHFSSFHFSDIAILPLELVRND